MTRILIAVGLAIAALAVVAGCGGDAGGGESGEQPPFSTAVPVGHGLRIR